MRRWLTLVLLVTTGIAAFLLARPALSRKPTLRPCPGGLFLLRQEGLVTGPVGSQLDGVVVQGPQLRIALSIGCDPAVAKIRATRKGTTVRANWKDCGGLKGKIQLAGTINLQCTKLHAKLTARKSKVRNTFDATLATCGDGIFDAGYEACEPAVGGCPGGGFCRSDCTCETTTTTIQTPTTTTTSLPDTTGPTITFDFPAPGEVIGTAVPLLRMSFSDASSGVDPATVKLTLDGVDITAQAVIGAAGATYQVPSALALGLHTLTARVRDRKANESQGRADFTVARFQATADCGPLQGKAPLQVTFRSRAEFTGGSIESYQWDFDGDGTFDSYDAVPQDYQYTFPHKGRFVAVLQITNNLGGHATDSCTIDVAGNAPRATASAAPSNGALPLAVAFTCTGTDTDGTIARYEWDFDGNGTFDFSSTTSGSVSHTYASQGTFPAVCRVTDDDGLTATARAAATTVRVGPRGSPSVTATATPADGQTPLTVSLDGSAVDDGTITKWEWDFDGDGVFDYLSTTSPAVSHLYDAAGIFAATLRATDDTGLTGSDVVEVTATVTVSLGVPRNTLRFLQPGTIVNLVPILPVTTNVSSSYPGYPPSRAVDGSLGTSWFTNCGDAANLGTTPFFEVVFPSPVTVTQVNLRGNREFSEGYDFTRGRFDVIGSSGTFSQTVDLPAPTRDVNLDIPDQTGVQRVRFTSLGDESCEPGFAELQVLGPLPPPSAAIETTLSGTISASLSVRNRAGEIVRHLVSNQRRTAGNYADTWDGKDDGGVQVKQGVYYVVLEFPFAGEVFTFDLTNLTGGFRYNPPRNPLPSTFAPFDDNQLAITFTIPASQGASEVLAFVGLFNVDTRLVTLLDRVPLGAGTHTVKWDGFDATGHLGVAPPGDSFLLGVFAYTLPDNAIFVDSAPDISNVTVDPNFFDPSTRDCITPGDPMAVVTFDVDKVADLELAVTNLATGRVIRHVVRPNTPAGTGQTIAWDGRVDDGRFADRGDYRLALRAVDSTGSPSLVRGALVRVFY